MFVTMPPRCILTVLLLAFAAIIMIVPIMSLPWNVAAQTQDAQMPILNDLERSKFDSGLLEELTRQMINHTRDAEGPQPRHNVVLVVNRTADLIANITSQEMMAKNKNSLVQKLADQLGATNVRSYPSR